MNSQRVSLPSQRVMFCKHEVHPDFLEKGLDVRFRQTTFSISSLSLTAGPRGAPGEKERGEKKAPERKSKAVIEGLNLCSTLSYDLAHSPAKMSFYHTKGLDCPV